MSDRDIEAAKLGAAIAGAAVGGVVAALRARVTELEAEVQSRFSENREQAVRMNVAEARAADFERKLIAREEETDRLIKAEEADGERWRERYEAVSRAMGDKDGEVWRSTHDLPERVAGLRAALEGVYALVADVYEPRNGSGYRLDWNAKTVERFAAVARVIGHPELRQFAAPTAVQEIIAAPPDGPDHV